MLDESNPHMWHMRDGTTVKLDVNSAVYTMDMWVCVDETGLVFKLEETTVTMCIRAFSDEERNASGLPATISKKNEGVISETNEGMWIEQNDRRRLHSNGLADGDDGQCTDQTSEWILYLHHQSHLKEHEPNAENHQAGLGGSRCRDGMPVVRCNQGLQKGHQAHSSHCRNRFGAPFGDNQAVKRLERRSGVIHEAGATYLEMS